jgi:hypothetical protein
MIGPFSKTIGPFTLSITDKGNGVFEGAISLNATIGGGSAANVVKCGGSLFADMSAEQVEALGFSEVNKIVPAAALPFVEGAEAAAEGATGNL